MFTFLHGFAESLVLLSAKKHRKMFSSGLMLSMFSTFRVRQIWLPRDIDYTGGYFTRNLKRILETDIEFIDDKKKRVDVEIVGVFSELPSFLSRYRQKMILQMQNFTGHNFIHGGLNKDVALKYDMRNPPQTTGYKRRVWFSGENIRPPFGFDYDATISFDRDNYGKTNIYGPISYLILTEHPSWLDPLLGKRINLQTLAEPRNLKSIDRKSKLACAFIGNNHNTRLRFIEELRKFGEVDVFGTAVGRPIKDKSSVTSQYKFVICFENDLFPGYITEKLVHGYACGAIPLYWGDTREDKVFNKTAYLNLANFDSLAEFAYVAGNLSDDDYERIFSEPLVQNTAPIESLVQDIRRVFTTPSVFERS